MALEEVECGLCGLSLGLGVPGGRKWCSECGNYVLAKAEHGDAGAVVGAAVAVGAGLLAAYALSRLFGNRR
jgi:hypothetical protein